jgi:hypothetical protein
MEGNLQGKGMWIWQVAQCEGGDVAKIAARAKEAGLTHVLVKVADGRSAYNGDVTALVRALQGAGIAVWAWQYTYGTHPEEEAQFAAQRFGRQPFAGFVVDAEGEYGGYPNRAKRYMQELRRLLPDTPVALSSYYLPDLHAEFPWAEFLAGCDVNMPQVYWYSRGPVQALEQSLAQNAKYGKPVFPTGAAYPEAAQAEEIVPFLDAVRAHNLPGANFWDWQEATAAMWTAVAGYLWQGPRLIVALPPYGGADYAQVRAEFREGRFWVAPKALAARIGLTVPDETAAPLRDVAEDLGLDLQYATQHLADPNDPRLYAFAQAPVPTALPPSLTLRFVGPRESDAVSGVVPILLQTANPSALPRTAAALVQVEAAPGQWADKGWAVWSQNDRHDFVFSPGWDTSGTPVGPKRLHAALCDQQGGAVLAEATIQVTVQRPSAGLAEVARGAEGKLFIARSYSPDPHTGEKRYLDRATGLCRAYAAECLAEFYVSNGQPNKRHSQTVFLYDAPRVGDSAESWAAALLQGLECKLGTWYDRDAVWPQGLEAGDMIFWMQDVNGYAYALGHVAIVVSVGGDGVVVSENSSSRGNGTHGIGNDDLHKMAGVMRWHR